MSGAGFDALGVAADKAGLAHEVSAGRFRVEGPEEALAELYRGHGFELRTDGSGRHNVYSDGVYCACIIAYPPDLTMRPGWAFSFTAL